MSRARRAILILGVALVAAGLLAAALGGWMVGTRSGARWAFERLGAALPGELRITDLDGSIRGPLRVRGLHYQAEDFEVTAAEARLEWSLGRLLARRLDVHSLTADSVTVRIKPPAEKARERAQRPLPDVDLPLDIHVAHGRVTRLAVHGPLPTEPLVVDTVGLEGLAFRDTMVFRRLAVRSPLLDVDLEGRLRPRGAWPLALEARFAAPAAGARVRGAVLAGGSLDTLVLEPRVEAPFHARLEARVLRLLDDPRFEAEGEFRGLSPAAFDPGLPDGAWAGRLRLRGTPEAFTGSGRLAGRGGDLGPLEASYRVDRLAARWRIERLEVRVPGGGPRLSATGEVVDGAGGPRIDLDARWSDLAWPLRGAAAWSSPSGRARLAGTPASYRVVVAGGLAVAGAPSGAWRLEGRGDTTSLDLSRLELDVAGGTLGGSGRIAWAPAVSWRAAVSGEGFRTAAFDPAWPGVLGLAATTEGRLGAGGPAGAVTLERLAGTVRGLPLEASGTLQLGGTRHAIERATLAWGGARLAASGAVGDAWDLGWTLEAPSLARLDARARGALDARGRLTGPGAAPRWTAEARGDSLAWGALGARRLTLEADVDPRGALRLDLAALAPRSGVRSLDRLEVGGRGSLGDQRWTAVAAGAHDRLEAALAGAAVAGGWRGRLERLDLESRGAGAWALAAPADVSAVGGAVALRDFCWISGEARLCADFERGAAGPWSAQASLAALPLAVLSPLLPPGLRVEGPISGRLRGAAGADGVLDAEIALEPGPGVVSRVAAGDSAAVRFERGALAVRSGAAGLVATLAAALTGTGTLEGRFELPGFRLGRPPAAQRLEGRLAADLGDLSAVGTLAPGIEGTRGRLAAAVDLGGTLAAPAARGEVRLDEGRALVPAAGIELEAIRLRAARDTAGDWAFEGGARSGPGSVRLEGRARWAAGKPRLAATLRGERFQAADIREARVLVSPDLRIEVEGRRADLEGEVVVPWARLAPRARSAEVVAPAEDVVVVQRARAPAAPAQDLHARVRLVLGSDVQIDAFGLEAEPAGAILALDEPGRPTRGTGELRISGGTYRAYGQDLRIERGRLIFGGGPIEDPAVDLRASRTAADGVVAGFEVRGTLRQPVLSVFSTPAMGESQALAYALFGRRLEDLSSGEGAMATRIATALEVPGGNLLLGELTSGLGFEEARIQSEGGLRDASLVLGRVLSPRLYVQYGVGLFDAVSTVRLRYTLSRMWSLGAEVAGENRADVQYRVEW